MVSREPKMKRVDLLARLGMVIDDHCHGSARENILGNQENNTEESSKGRWEINRLAIFLLFFSDQQENSNGGSTRGEHCEINRTPLCDQQQLQAAEQDNILICINRRIPLTDQYGNIGISCTFVAKNKFSQLKNT